MNATVEPPEGESLQAFLHTLPLFAGLGPGELAEVERIAQIRSFPAGAVILTEGTSGGALHVIRSGKVRISKTIPGVGEEALTVLDGGQFFGEMEFLDGAPASAHALAHTDCVTVAIPHSEVKALMDTHPGVCARFLWAFARTLAARLRETDERFTGVFAISSRKF